MSTQAAVKKAKHLAAKKRRRKQMGLTGDDKIVVSEKATKTAHTDSAPSHRGSSTSTDMQRDEEQDEYSDGTVYSDEEEDHKDYCKGGYHPVNIGDKFNNGKYTVVRKLGWGHFSTVWLCKDNVNLRYVALKIVKSAAHYTETAIDEIKLLEKVVKANPNSPSRKYVVELLDHFKHRGPNGTHICMIFEVLGENLLSLIRRYHHQGVPVHLVKQIAFQVLSGLDYLHRECGIIHTDLKPENVLVVVDVNEVVKKLGLEPLGQLSNSQATKIAGDGTEKQKNGTSVDIKLTESSTQPPASSNMTPSSLSIQLPNPPPESTPSKSQSDPSSAGAPLTSSPATKVLERTLSDISLNDLSSAPQPQPKLPPVPIPSSVTSKSNPSSPSKASSGKGKRKNKKQPPLLSIIDVKIADLGNACWVDHHFTNDIQTRQYRSPEVILGGKWGTSADLWSAGCMLFELLTGDYLFDPQPGQRYTKDDDHIAQIIELLGNFPKTLALSGKYSGDIFNRRGELRHIHKLRYWPLSSVLHEKYNLAKPDADLLASFIQPMIHIIPDQRATAAVMTKHQYLDGFRDWERAVTLKTMGLDSEGIQMIERLLAAGNDAKDSGDGLISSSSLSLKSAAPAASKFSNSPVKSTPHETKLSSSLSPSKSPTKINSSFKVPVPTSPSKLKGIKGYGNSSRKSPEKFSTPEKRDQSGSPMKLSSP
ncbi:kinase-like domain-containing protein [Paraphysoderma sedebokerense]|nr:kinase-like domain-containing protein [Paraphysoderma sedebokerense]